MVATAEIEEAKWSSPGLTGRFSFSVTRLDRG